MRRLLFDRVERPAVAGRAGLLLAGAVFALGTAAPAYAQQDTVADTMVAVDLAADSVVAAAVSVSDAEASLELGLSNGRTVDLELVDGDVRVDGRTLGRYDEGDAFDRSWRQLLEEAAMASTAALPGVLRAWDPPATGGAVARELDERLEQALAGVGGRTVATVSKVTSAEDSIDELLARIDELEEDLEDEHYYREASPGEAFLNDVAEGIAGFFATLIWIGVLFGLGAAVLFFATGRLERIATTAREEPVRSGLIGLAGAFLAIPFYVLVTIALAISVLGIPLIVAWAPIFPALVVLSFLAGWLAVAYSAGDALITDRLSAQPRFQDAGVYKRMFVGVALLMSPFLLGALFHMTSVLEWVGGVLMGLGIVANMLVGAVGFGAVLVRGRDAMDRQRERRAAARRAREEQATVVTTSEGTNV